MSTGKLPSGKAQDRLDKLKTRLKTERSNVSVRPEKASVKSSVTKPRKKDKNCLENSSDDKKKRIKECINLALNQPTASTQVVAKARTKNSTPGNSILIDPLPNQNAKSSAQSRLKRYTQQKKTEKNKSIPDRTHQPKPNQILQSNPPNPTDQLKPHKQSSVSRNHRPPSQLPAKYRIPKTYDQPQDPNPVPAPTAKCARPSTQSSALPAQYYVPTHQTAEGMTSLPDQTHQCKPATLSSASQSNLVSPVKFRTPTTQPSARPADYARPPALNSTYSAACAASTHQTAGNKTPPDSISRAAAVPRVSPKSYKNSNPSPEVQKNLFRRKPPGSVNNQNSAKGQSSSSQDPKTQSCPYQRPETKPKPPNDWSSCKGPKDQGSWTSGLGGWVAKTCKGVVEAVKGTMSLGSGFSSYSLSRPNVTKQLQNVRSLVEPVEMMDYEISCPTFESEQASIDQTDLHLVIDTNVVLDNLGLIRSLKYKKVKGMTPKIIIPWQVLKELDYLKENRNKLDYMHTNASARKGIRFLLEEIINSDGFIGGQPQHVASRDFVDFVVEVPDDHLIKCCLQLKWAGCNVLLLTNDKNLIIKAVVSEVSSMRCDEFAKICQESGESELKPLTCFEMPPSASYSGTHLIDVNAAHRVIILLRGFLSAVLKKFWVYKFHNLWKLRSPGQEPWPLTTLLDIAYETWNEISCDQSQSYSEVILFLRRFIHKMNYERLVYQDLDKLGRACQQLAVSVPPTFGVEGITFDHSLAFLKCIDDSGPPADASFIDSCVSLTVQHFQMFENKAVQYCYGISQKYGIPFNYPKIAPAYQSDANPTNIHSHMRVVSDIGRSLVKVSASPISEITKSSEAAQAIHSTLTTYLGELADHRFVLQDVVEFCNCPEMRKSFTSALQDLEILSSFLESVSRR